MIDETERKIDKLFKTDAAKSHFGMDASIGSQARIVTNALADKFNKLFASIAPDESKRMVASSVKASTTSLHNSIQAMSGGLSLKTSMLTSETKEIIKASVAENTSLIKSIASEYMKKISTAVLHSIMTGGIESLKDKVQEIGGQTERRAANIALDQTRKVYNSVNASKAKGLGIKKFEWIHSGGGLHPRPEHIALNGKIFSYNNLPIIDKKTGERGLPAQLPNCKCTQRPVITFGD
jgi:SPP1 gp7 family putative phage head morphogenesis protein